jgi:hypothetical protein
MISSALLASTISNDGGDQLQRRSVADGDRGISIIAESATVTSSGEDNGDAIQAAREARKYVQPLFLGDLKRCSIF